MNDLKGNGSGHAAAVWIHAEKDFREEIANRIEEDERGAERKRAVEGMAAEELEKLKDDQADGTERGECVRDEDSPQKIFGAIEVAHEDFGAAAAFAGLLANAP